MMIAAAFGRLCVETFERNINRIMHLAAAFGRLCVETKIFASLNILRLSQPPSGGCVLKLS